MPEADGVSAWIRGRCLWQTTEDGTVGGAVTNVPAIQVGAGHHYFRVEAFAGNFGDSRISIHIVRVKCGFDINTKRYGFATFYQPYGTVIIFLRQLDARYLRR